MEAKRIVRSASYKPLVALQFALVAGVAEVLVRHGLTSSTDQAFLLAFAVFGNVAALGLVAVGAVVVLEIVRILLGLAVPAVNGVSRIQTDGIILGATVAFLLFQSELLGLGRLMGPWVSLGVPVGAGIITFIRIGRQDPKATQTAGALTGVVIPAAWACCVVMTLVGFYQGNRYLQGWLDAGSRRQEQLLPTARPNILVVVIDTLRADKVGVCGGKSLTPNIDRFAEKAVVYPNAFSTAPWTLPAHASLFTGLYPKELGVNWGCFHLDERYPTLAGLLGERGYECWAISNNQLLTHSNGFARGFDAFLESCHDGWLRRFDMLFKCGVFQYPARLAGLAPGYTEDKGAAWTNWLLTQRLRRRGPNARPFFAFINYYEVHDPYAPPREYLARHLTGREQKASAGLDMNRDSLVVHSFLPGRRYSSEEINLLEKLYDAEVSYQDRMIGDLLQRLRECGVDDNTWVVITSDHGELFGEQGMISHVAGNHHHLLHVPLIVRPPKAGSSCRIEAPVQLVDVFATLLEVAGVEKPSHCDRAYALPLHPGDPPQRRVCVAQTYGAAIFGLSIAQRLQESVQLDRWLTWMESVYEDGHLLEQESSGAQRLFDVNHDPDMEHDLVSSRPDLARTLAQRLRQWSRGGKPSQKEIAYGWPTSTELVGPGSDRGGLDVGPRGP